MSVKHAPEIKDFEVRGHYWAARGGNAQGFFYHSQAEGRIKFALNLAMWNDPDPRFYWMDKCPCFPTERDALAYLFNEVDKQANYLRVRIDRIDRKAHLDT